MVKNPGVNGQLGARCLNDWIFRLRRLRGVRAARRNPEPGEGFQKQGSENWLLRLRRLRGVRAARRNPEPGEGFQKQGSENCAPQVGLESA